MTRHPATVQASRACLLICIGLGICVAPALGDLNVWTTTQTVRVLRDAAPGKSLAVSLGAARNEWESFQILVRSDTELPGVNVQPGDLTGPEGAVLRAADARCFRQHQMELTEGTYRNKDFHPGWYPDGLIPFRHPVTGKPLGLLGEKARLTAVPFDLPAGQTHGFWVDLYVPPDAKAGTYRGTYGLTAGGAKAVEVPVTLEVWDFALPAAPALCTEFGSPAQRMRGYYRQRAKEGKEQPLADWSAVETQCAEMLSRHRVNATPPSGSIAPVRQADGSYAVPPEQTAAFRQFVQRYHVNAFCVPHPGGAVKDPDAEHAKLAAWLKSWDAVDQAVGPGKVVFYTYLKDEPNDEPAYRYVQKWGKAVRKAGSVVRVLVVEQTWTQDPKWGDLYGAVDIWVPLFSLFKADSAAKRQSLGETIWTYTALCQLEPTPWWHIDYPLLNYRAAAWIAWRFGMRGLLYWGGLSYWSQVDDPWTDPKTYGRRSGGKGPVYNGEGSIVYPARAAGYDGIAPSLRLKALRDSIEDYDYLDMLARAGRGDDAKKIVLPLAQSWFKWDKDPAAYEAARAKLAALIVAAGKAKP